VPKKTKKKIQKKVTTAAIELPTTKSIPAVMVNEYIQLFYGPPGVGKTTFVNAMADKVLFISTDRGTRFLSSLRMEINDFQDFLDLLKVLEKKPTKDMYDIIALDHIDDICGMIEDHICVALGIDALGDVGYGGGWKAYKKAINAVIQRLLRLDTGLVFIAHETIKTIRTKVLDTERIMPDLPKSAWKIIIPKCDIVGYCGFRVVKRAGKKQEIRILETAPREELYCKDRTSRVQPELGYISLSGSEFKSSFNKEGVKKHGKKTKRSQRKKV